MQVPRPVAAMAKDFAAGYRIPEDAHSRGQLVHAVEGVMTVTTPHGIWVVPPERAVWVPPRTPHSTRMSGRVAMRTLYIRAAECARLPQVCCVVPVSPLLRELIVRACELPLRYDETGPGPHVMALLLHELAAMRTLPLHLPRPRDARIVRVCDALAADPADTGTLTDWARRVGASERNLARLFVRETGMTFAAWRAQARLVAALERLAAGTPVSRIAFDLGYATPSAFTAMFRKTLGIAPREYFSRQSPPPPTQEIP
jgi:AraC-like DNA-binding protein